ncbi:SAM4 [Sanghuangporus weigelae]
MSSKSSPPRLVLLDGGLGTTLEDVFKKNISSPLWSASIVDKDPDTIVQAHSAFLDAGSDVILTATYQCAFETFERAGYSKVDAILLMRKAVRLAARAKTQVSRDNRPVSIALSLGPYGSTLSPPQEYGGFYPPPYGPRAYTEDGENFNAFTDMNDERAATLALADFHYERLKVFADDGEDSVWPLIDLIAFETVPIQREIYAIRIAMDRLKSHLSSRGLAYKPWWISTVWPMDASYHPAYPGGGIIAYKCIAHALLFGHGPIEHKGSIIGMAVPEGIGINCTHIAQLNDVLPKVRGSVAGMRIQKMPFLVLYPNGGNIYDIMSRRWIPEEELNKGKDKTSPEMWASCVATIASAERDSGVWQQVIVGGCCKTTPKHIETLSRAWNSSDSMERDADANLNGS